MRSSNAVRLSIAFITCACTLNAQTSSVAANKLKAIADHTTLDAPGIRPWHWKMDVNIYDSDGKNPQPGTIEAWFANGNMRTVMTIGDAQLTTLRVDDKLYRSDGDSVKFVPLDVVFMNALHPVPDVVLQPSVPLKLVPLTLGSAKLDCVQPTFAPPPPGEVNLGIPLSYCVSQGTDRFVVVIQAVQTSVARPQIGTFQSKQVPMTLQISSASKKRADMKTTALSTYTPTPEEFAVPTTMHPLVDPMEVPAPNATFGLALYHESLRYPEAAKSRNVSGSAKFDVVISKEALSSPDILQVQSICNWLTPPQRRLCTGSIALILSMACQFRSKHLS